MKDYFLEALRTALTREGMFHDTDISEITNGKLRRLANHKNVDVSKAAVEVLGTRERSIRVTELLLEIVWKNRHSWSRWKALVALARDTRRLFPVDLEKTVLDDPDPDNRALAAEILGDIEGSEPLLNKALARENKRRRKERSQFVLDCIKESLEKQSSLSP